MRAMMRSKLAYLTLVSTPRALLRSGNVQECSTILAAYAYTSSRYSRRRFAQRGLHTVGCPSSVYSPTHSTCQSKLRLYSSLGNEDKGHTSDQHQQMSRECRQIMDASIAAVDPARAIHRSLSATPDGLLNVKLSNGQSRTYDLKSEYDTILVVAFGKASTVMANTVLQVLQDCSVAENKDSSSTNSDSHDKSKSPLHIKGVVITKDGHYNSSETPLLDSNKVGEMQVYEAGHPVPDERSVEASTAVLDLIEEHASPSTLVLCCISGGGSALFCAPDAQISLQDIQATNKVLLQSGWNIMDMNVVRKRLERGKGGRLAAAAYPSKLVSFVLSDVLGDPLDLIASGPTVPDTSTYKDAYKLVQSLPSNHKLPDSVMDLIKKGASGDVSDSPLPTDPVFQSDDTNTVLVSNNAIAVQAAARKAKELGYNPVILSTTLEGEAKHVASVFVSMAQYVQQQQQQQHGHQQQNHNQNTSNQNHERDNDDSLDESSLYPVGSLPASLIFGGETTVSLNPADKGVGGRNQELALAAAVKLYNKGIDGGMSGIVVGCVGTDGTDGPTDAAGAIVHCQSVTRLDVAEDALARHDAYTYFSNEAAASLVKTGPTGTNVADVYIILVR